MEPRACIGEYDPDEDRYTIRCTIQSVHQTRSALAGQIFKLPQSRVRVVCDNMGDSDVGSLCPLPFLFS